MAKKQVTRIDVITDGFIDSITALVSLGITFCLSEHGPVASAQLLEAISKHIDVQLVELRKMAEQYNAAVANNDKT